MSEMSRPDLPTAEVLSFEEGLKKVEEKLNTTDRLFEKEFLTVGVEELKKQIKNGGEFPNPEPVE
jgi:hypothetical protein